MVELTAFSAWYLPIALAIGLWWRAVLPALLVVSVVLHAPAAMVLEIGGTRFGISPFLFACGLVGIDLGRRAVRERRLAIAGRDVDGASRLWLAFLAWTVLSALLLPHLFEGLPVHLLGAREPVLEPPRPLHWGPGHLGQIVNALALAIVLAWLHQVRSPRTVRSLFVGFAVAVVLAFGVGLYQRLAMQGVVAWHPEFWGSNPSYNQNFLARTYGPNIGRVGLPFTEPLYASVWFALAAAATFCWWVYGRELRSRALAAGLFVLALLGLANSLGTAGILAFGLSAGMLVLFHACHGWRFATRLTSVVLVWPLALALLAAGWLVAAILLDQADWFARWSDSGYRWVHDKYVELFQGYRHRADRQALHVFVATWGLGAGAGSVRASGYLTALLGNMGVPGLVLFLSGLVATARAVWCSRDEIGRAALAWAGGLIALLVGIGGGISDQAWPPTWMMLFGGVALVLIARAPEEKSWRQAGPEEYDSR
jgi:hypothetical protein